MALRHFPRGFLTQEDEEEIQTPSTSVCGAFCYKIWNLLGIVRPGITF